MGVVVGYHLQLWVRNGHSHVHPTSIGMWTLNYGDTCTHFLPGTAPHFEPLWKLKWNYHKGALSAIPFGAIGTMIVELEMNDVWKDLPYQSSFIWVCLRLGYPNPPYCLKHDLPQQWTQGSVYCRSMGCPFWKKPQGPDGLRTLMFQGRKSWFPPHLHLIANP